MLSPSLPRSVIYPGPTTTTPTITATTTSAFAAKQEAEYNAVVERTKGETAILWRRIMHSQSQLRGPGNSAAGPRTTGAGTVDPRTSGGDRERTLPRSGRTSSAASTGPATGRTSSNSSAGYVVGSLVGNGAETIVGFMPHTQTGAGSEAGGQTGQVPTVAVEAQASNTTSSSSSSNNTAASAKPSQAPVSNKPPQQPQQQPSPQGVGGKKPRRVSATGKRPHSSSMFDFDPDDADLAGTDKGTNDGNDNDNNEEAQFDPDNDEEVEDTGASGSGSGSDSDSAEVTGRTGRTLFDKGSDEEDDDIDTVNSTRSNKTAALLGTSLPMNIPVAALGAWRERQARKSSEDHEDRDAAISQSLLTGEPIVPPHQISFSLQEPSFAKPMPAKSVI
eukprot:TRINITY_DN2979_c0_g1_i3.p1 TRINITY_DN2979_c0_g1~~TRINITY_DN2979_c0_g1_i3.p1  ORF type:complete len:390 (+),score=64.43 TRINITY_DN2979_c0_g1_i3:827-1996(+)